MVEPVINERSMSDLTTVLLDRAAAVDPAVLAERHVFRPLARAYFRDRERALAGHPPPITTLMLETSRIILDHLVADSLERGGPWPSAPSRHLQYDVHLQRIITEVLTHHLPSGRARRLASAITYARREAA